MHNMQHTRHPMTCCHTAAQ